MGDVAPSVKKPSEVTSIPIVVPDKDAFRLPTKVCRPTTELDAVKVLALMSNVCAAVLALALELMVLRDISKKVSVIVASLLPAEIKTVPLFESEIEDVTTAVFRFASPTTVCALMDENPAVTVAVPATVSVTDVTPVPV